PLKDVVVWYGLSQGIKDNILKEVSGNIYSYDYSENKIKDFVREVIEDFFRDYKEHTLPDGTPAKIALYFPQEDDLVKIRPVVETTLTKLGFSPGIVLKNTSRSTKAEEDAFKRLNHKESPHRVILLVNKGTEGWDCPSLFSCALIRKLKTSNNFVLQAATRCLRQVPGNNKKARIYLSEDNRSILEKQLNETYGETLAQLNNSSKDYSTVKIYIRKVDIAPLEIKKEIQRVIPKPKPKDLNLSFSLPKTLTKKEPIKKVLQIEDLGKRTRLIEKESALIKTTEEVLDIYTATTELSAIYRVPADIILSALKEIYPKNELPRYHLSDLSRQLEKQLFD
ncbi:MAG: restriction endonuclease subunit R, partial [Candidatus Omnitrophica bacterium]|nr:restriction endonuclease subunit R [Candidatus Omnitrophota bacterium]